MLAQTGAASCVQRNGALLHENTSPVAVAAPNNSSRMNDMKVVGGIVIFEEFFWKKVLGLLVISKWIFGTLLACNHSPSEVRKQTELGWSDRDSRACNIVASELNSLTSTFTCRVSKPEGSIRIATSSVMIRHVLCEVIVNQRRLRIDFCFKFYCF